MLLQIQLVRLNFEKTKIKLKSNIHYVIFVTSYVCIFLVNDTEQFVVRSTGRRDSHLVVISI